ncbi:thiamine diphosphokinase [Granulosicoccaceae sp. 1_MG-2023]|nr:thiamine diphosphokinase [Granulosicoccaceae sp. 1_MG-2023]
MSRRALILANGQVADYALLSTHLHADDLLICADGGLAHARALGLQPHWLVGDLDSVEAAWLEELDSATQIERYPAGKNETDLELALQRAQALAVDSVLVAGLGGGRLDHALANVLLLAQQRWPFRLSFVEGGQRACILRGGAQLTLGGPVGTLVSLLPLPGAAGIVTRGLQYPLCNESLSFGTPRGISNVISEAGASLQLAEGTLLVIQTPPAD